MTKMQLMSEAVLGNIDHYSNSAEELICYRFSDSRFIQYFIYFEGSEIQTKQ